MNSVKITEKPVAPSVDQADTLMIVIGGKLYRAELRTLSDILSASQVAEIEDAGNKAISDIVNECAAAERVIDREVGDAVGVVSAAAETAKEDISAAVSAGEAEIAESVDAAKEEAAGYIADLTNIEEWVFELEDGTSVTKRVVLSDA